MLHRNTVQAHLPNKFHTPYSDTHLPHTTDGPLHHYLISFSHRFSYGYLVTTYIESPCKHSQITADHSVRSLLHIHTTLRRWRAVSTRPRLLSPFRSDERLPWVPASCGRVAVHNPYCVMVSPLRSASRHHFGLSINTVTHLQPWALGS